MAISVCARALEEAEEPRMGMRCRSSQRDHVCFVSVSAYTEQPQQVGFLFFKNFAHLLSGIQRRDLVHSRAKRVFVTDPPLTVILV